VYKPVEYIYEQVDFSPDLAQLKPTKKTTLHFFHNTIAEDYYDGSAQKGADYILRSTTRAPEVNPVVQAYQQGFPFIMKLKNEKDARELLKALNVAFEKTGVNRNQVMPASDIKPVLVLVVDGKSDVELGQVEQAVVDKYFTRVTFDDPKIKKLFLDTQKEMIENVKGTMLTDKKDYVTDGYLGAISRTLNDGFKKFEGHKLIAAFVGIVSITILTKYIEAKVNKWIVEKGDNLGSSIVDGTRRASEWIRSGKAATNPSNI